MVIEKTGTFLPSKLAGELREAGIDVDGVTCTEDAADVVAVQIICAGEPDEATIDAVCAAHDPAELIDAAPVELSAAAVTFSAGDELIAALEKLPPDQPVTASDLLAILRPEPVDDLTVEEPKPDA